VSRQSPLPYSHLRDGHQGPIIGGAFVEGDLTPLSIHKQFFDEICPHPRIITAEAIWEIINDKTASALTIHNTWKTYLQGINDPCVEVARDSDRIFDYLCVPSCLFIPVLIHLCSIYGQKDRLLPIWPVLSQSPVLRLLGPSPLIQSAFDTNRALFAPFRPIEPYAPPSSLDAPRDPYSVLPGLLVLHVRRGDFAEHCANLAYWAASFNAFNSFPELPDAWVAPPGAPGGGAEPTGDAMRVYEKRCFPSVQEIVGKVEEVRRSDAGRGLRNIYVMTNAKKNEARELEAALRAMGGWESIATSRDLVLTKEQKYVAQAVDMLIGQRAQVLIGNGVCTILFSPLRRY
jgi:hypothetical protein